MGHLPSKLTAQLSSFRSSLLTEALKVQLSLCAWDTVCSVVPLTKDMYSVGREGGVVPVCPLFSPLQLIQWAL